MCYIITALRMKFATMLFVNMKFFDEVGQKCM